jgi:carbonic anhydrase/acetyltransferase-like protein (isoleucine patch superfamily)
MIFYHIQGDRTNMAIYKFEENTPDIAATAYIADNATIIGKVKIENNASVWFNVTVRGDNETITVGQNSNVQEGAVLHTDMGYPLVVGELVTVGHQVMLHGCTVGDGSLIGMQAVVLNGAKIGKNCLVGAGALVTEGKEFPDNSLIIGSPAKAIRTLTTDDIARMQAGARHYVTRAQQFKTSLTRIG